MFLYRVTRNGSLQNKNSEVGLSEGPLGSPTPASSPSSPPRRRRAGQPAPASVLLFRFSRPGASAPGAPGAGVRHCYQCADSLCEQL